MLTGVHVRVGVLAQSFILNKNHPINAVTCTHKSAGFRIPTDGSHDHYRPHLPRAILSSKSGEDDDKNEIGKDEFAN